jgi:hypothetical protein
LQAAEISGEHMKAAAKNQMQVPYLAARALAHHDG